MWNLGCGWGVFIRTENKYKIVIADGTLNIKSVTLGGIDLVKNIRIDGKKIHFIQEGCCIFFDNTEIKKEIVIEV